MESETSDITQSGVNTATIGRILIFGMNRIYTDRHQGQSIFFILSVYNISSK
jgi:hypothetical protein